MRYLNYIFIFTYKCNLVVIHSIFVGLMIYIKRLCVYDWGILFEIECNFLTKLGDKICGVHARIYKKYHSICIIQGVFIRNYLHRHPLFLESFIYTLLVLLF